MTLIEQMQDAMDSLKDLEFLYREDADAFTVAFPELFNKHPDSIILQIWDERISYKKPIATEVSLPYVNKRKPLLSALLIGSATGFLAILFSRYLDYDVIGKNIVLLVFFSLIVYFGVRNLRNKYAIIAILIAVIGSTTFLNYLPNDWQSDTILLSVLHTPIFFWALIGATFVAKNWKDLSKRNDYLRFNGEFVIYTIILYISWMVLFGISVLLFGWRYFNNFPCEEYFLIFGLSAIPAITTYIVENEFKFKFNITTILSKVFTPLFFLIETVFLISMLINKENPFIDRDFLMVCNLLLFLTLALTIFTIIERTQTSLKKYYDYITLGLTSITWIINAITLSAILFRLVSFGFTPNRVAMLGANVLFFVHLTGILVNFIRYLLNRIEMITIHNWIAIFLPVYPIWVLFVAIGLPLIYNFK